MTPESWNSVSADKNSRHSRTRVDRKFLGVVCGMSIGMMFGAAIGIALKNLAAGFGVGICFGASFGLLFGRLFNAQQSRGQQGLGGDSENRAEDGTVPESPQG